MARGSLAENTPWRRRSLTIPPASWQDWVHLAVWEMWMGVLISGFLAVGSAMIVTAPDRIVTAEDLSGCYASPPVARPCERIVYRTGLLNTAFSVLFGLMAIVAGVWWVWELWGAVAPKPITDDFLKMLDDSFARNWRDPRTWPWSRVFYAYAFALIGSALAVSAGLGAQRLIADLRPLRPPIIKVNTSEDFRVSP
ncbi:MAG: hypothetical protein K2Y23_11600 [Cyanobacteria bacterium]|nr:hypothetical protein [Cyanobacteriota bacterium]